MDTYRHISTLRIDSNPVPAAVRQAKFHTFARCFLSTGRIELTGQDGVTRHFQVIREGNEVRLAKYQADRIGPIDVGAVDPDEKIAGVVDQVTDCGFPIGADSGVGQTQSPVAGEGS